NEEFFGPGTGWFQTLLLWDPIELPSDPEDTTASLPAQIKTGILETATLVQSVWSLVGPNKLPGLGDDAFVSQSSRFISTAIRSGYYKSLFSSRETTSSLVQGV
ncbi:hypothetical protein HYPSUDRAFT_121984, partial [Hypholoma sublateritium FD-334 SS-4]